MSYRPYYPIWWFYSPFFSPSSSCPSPCFQSAGQGSGWLGPWKPPDRVLPLFLPLHAKRSACWWRENKRRTLFSSFPLQGAKVCRSVSVCVCLSPCMFLSVSLFMCPSICMCFCPFLFQLPALYVIFFLIHLSIHVLYTCVSFSVSDYPSIHLPVYLFLPLSPLLSSFPPQGWARSFFFSIPSGSPSQVCNVSRVPFFPSIKCLVSSFLP